MKKRLFLVFLGGCLMGTPAAWADPAAMNNGAYGVDLLDISKGQESKVRLEKEALVFKCGKKTTEVDAKFWFKNTDPHSAVTQLSGFPDEALGTEDPLEGNVSGVLEKLKAFVDGKPVSPLVRYSYVEWSKDNYWVPSDKEKGQKVAWYTLPLVFPADGERMVEYRYRTKNGFFEYNPPYYFQYILYTGATWNGTIGELTADVQLKDGLTVKDLFWSPFSEGIKEQDTMLPDKEYWKILDGTHLRLSLHDFKPKAQRSLQQIRILSLAGAERVKNRWEVSEEDHFVMGKDCELVYHFMADAGADFLEVDSKMVSRATGGRHLSDYLKPGDVMEYSGTYFDYSNTRVADPQKDSFRIIKKH
jgi:hypothetical protein